MHRRNRFQRYIHNINREGFYGYFSSRLHFLYSTLVHPLIRRLRYQLVGLLYGHRFTDDIVKLSQLEYFCEEIVGQDIFGQFQLRSKEVDSLLKLANDYLSDKKYVEGLSLLDRARSIDEGHPVLLKLYTDYAEQIHFENGVGGLCDRAQTARLELQKRQYGESCFKPFDPSVKVLEQTWAGNIGHLGLLVKLIQAKQLGLLPNRNHILLVSRAANNCYLDYLRSFGEIKFIPKESYKKSYDYCFLPFSENLDMWETNNGYENLYLVINKIEESWKLEKRPPLLSIKPDHRERGLRVLEDLNIPADAWFVSLHVRSGSSGKNNLRDGRNCDVDSYIPAIKAITDAGGYVFRMGDHTMKPLPEMPNVVDYALSPYKSDWMDVFLWACCRFFVGTTSGPNFIPPSFGVPQLWTNATPFALCSIQFPNSLMVPKLWYSRAEQRLLTFSEILACPAGWSERRTLGDVVLVDNTADELADGVREMIELTQHGIEEGQYDIVKDLSNPLQLKLDEIRETYKTFGKLPVCRSFLEKYADLIA